MSFPLSIRFSVTCERGVEILQEVSRYLMPVIEMEVIRYTNRSGAGLLFKFPTEKEIELVPIVILLVSIVSLVFINHTTVELYLSDELETGTSVELLSAATKEPFLLRKISETWKPIPSIPVSYTGFTLDTGDACYNRRIDADNVFIIRRFSTSKVFYSVNTKLMNM